MTFVIPTAKLPMTSSHNSDARARGTIGTPTGTGGTKGNGNLPLTDSATHYTNGTDGDFEGLVWEFEDWAGAPVPYDVSSDTRVAIYTHQYNAPNRLEIATVANSGVVCRIYSGAGSPPTNYKSYDVGGNDTLIGKAREIPRMIVIDLNDTSHEDTGGTFDNTDVQCLAHATTGAAMGGSTNYQFFQRLFVLETTKGATDIPRFTGASDWDDIITAVGTAFDTKITSEWLQREGIVFQVACPLEFGDNSTSTQFDDNGAAVFWPDHDEVGNPRTRVTEQAFRVYSNLRNNVADTLDMSGSYDCGNSYPLWDFDQDDAAVITFAGVNFKRTGTFLMGSSVTGIAIFDDCGLVDYVDNGVNLDGSTFRNPHSTHLLSLAA